MQIKFIRTTNERDTVAGDFMIPCETVEAFRDGLTFYDAWRDVPPFYGWTPGYPCASYGSFGGPSDEALYQSNYRMTVEEFKESLGIELSGGSSDTFEIPADNIQAIALACKLDADLEGYPVFDDEDYSDLEHELILECVEDYFRDDVLKAMFEDKLDSYSFLFDDDDEIIPDADDIVESEIRDIAFEQCAYSGEVYIFSMEDYLKGVHRITTEDHARDLRVRLEEFRRERFEAVYPPLPGIEV